MEAAHNSTTQDVLRWTVYPMREQPSKGFIFWPVTILTIWAVHWNIQHPVLTIVAAIVLYGSLTSYYLPTRYTLDQQGAQFKRWIFHRQMRWERVRSVVDEREGLFLSPFPVKTRLENFRGLFLPYRDNRTAVLNCVHRYVPQAKGLPDEIG